MKIRQEQQRKGDRDQKYCHDSVPSKPHLAEPLMKGYYWEAWQGNNGEKKASASEAQGHKISHSVLAVILRRPEPEAGVKSSQTA